jgi:hypothetical protein
MREQQVEIVRGTVFIVTGKRPPEYARSFVARHLARPGEVVTLPADEAARLVRSGAVKAVQVG